MATKLLAPFGATAFAHGGEEYEVKGGAITIPDGAVEIARSHGFRFPDQAPPPVSSNDELITDDDNEAEITPETFASGLTQPGLKEYLRYMGVPIPKTGTVGDLRALVAQIYREHGTTRPGEAEKKDEDIAAAKLEAKDAPRPTENTTDKGGDKKAEIAKS